jgi:hypothetical protein
VTIGPLIGAIVGSAVLGALVGLSGIGGFLLPAWLRATAGVPPAQAVPVTLVSFAISSLAASPLYARRGAVDVRLAAALAAASVPGIGLGLAAAAFLSQQAWSRLIGVALLLAAAWAPRTETVGPADPIPAALTWRVGATGLFAGAAAVLAGVTGPLVLLPGLRAAGVPAPTAVGTSLFASVGISFAAAAGYGALRGLPLTLTAYVLPSVVIGTLTGAVMGGRVRATALNRVIRILCAVAGLWMMLLR